MSPHLLSPPDLCFSLRSDHGEELLGFFVFEKIKLDLKKKSNCILVNTLRLAHWEDVAVFGGTFPKSYGVTSCRDLALPAEDKGWLPSADFHTPASSQISFLVFILQHKPNRRGYDFSAFLLSCTTRPCSGPRPLPAHVRGRKTFYSGSEVKSKP